MTRSRAILIGITLFALASAPIVTVQISAQQQPMDRAHQVGRKIKCMCGGCSDTAATCYHVGGAFSGPCDTAKGMLKEVEQRIARGDSDDLILQSFVQEYGTAVYVEPPNAGFGRVAWWTPVLFSLVGLGLVLFVISRWRKRPSIQPSGGAAASAVSPELLEQARMRAARETQD
jgi:cytochrome c-type biogenesis protein CcmH/NrfF